MVDPSGSGEPITTPVCPWCSAALTEGATVCPSCGANLIADGDPDVPGVTAVDAASIIRSRSAPKPRGRLISWISGEYQSDVPSPAEAQAIAPPDPEVRREILRLELEAEVANLQAEANALRAEAAAEGRSIQIEAAPDESPAEEPSGEGPSGEGPSGEGPSGEAADVDVGVSPDDEAERPT